MSEADEQCGGNVQTRSRCAEKEEEKERVATERSAGRESTVAIVLVIQFICWVFSPLFTCGFTMSLFLNVFLVNVDYVSE